MQTIESNLSFIPAESQKAFKEIYFSENRFNSDYEEIKSNIIE